MGGAGVFAADPGTPVIVRPSETSEFREVEEHLTAVAVVALADPRRPRIP